MMEVGVQILQPSLLIRTHPAPSPGLSISPFGPLVILLVPQPGNFLTWKHSAMILGPLFSTTQHLLCFDAFHRIILLSILIWAFQIRKQKFSYDAGKNPASFTIFTNNNLARASIMSNATLVTRVAQASGLLDYSPSFHPQLIMYSTKKQKIQIYQNTKYKMHAS